MKLHPEQTITVGIEPTFAHTGMGYIEKDRDFVNNTRLNLHHVKSFKEKPDESTAKKYLKSKKYLWNSGYFIWKTTTILSLYEQHLPEIY